jgi:pyruvate dehydrogenase E1 component beta subunit
MIQQAIASDDPVIFFEPKRRYWEKADVDTGADSEPFPLHRSRVVREGRDATLVTYGPMVRTCLDAATAAEAEGRSLEVIDLRTLSPLDLEPVFDSVRRTGHCVVVSEAPTNVSIAAEIAARVTERVFYSLESPVLRVGGYDIPYPPSRLEDHYLPDLDRVLDAVDRSMAF